jgi:hypothetical protein
MELKFIEIIIHESLQELLKLTSIFALRDDVGVPDTKYIRHSIQNALDYVIAIFNFLNISVFMQTV